MDSIYDNRTGPKGIIKVVCLYLGDEQMMT